MRRLGEVVQEIDPMASRAFSGIIHRSASTLLLAVSVAVLPLLTGCDNPTHTADLAVDDQIAKADSQTELAGKQNALDSAVKISGASTAEKLKAKHLQANSLLESAQDLSRTISRRSAVITNLAAEIESMSSQIAADNAEVLALKQLEPTKVQDAIKTESTAMTGSDDKPDWYKTDAATLDSLAANDKQATALNTQISQLQDTIKSETDQRTKLLADADTMSEQSEREKGQKSVDLFIQGSDNRKQAADLTVKLDQDNVLLARAQADLALHQGQQDALKGSIKQLGDRAAIVDQRWKEVQAQIDTINTASKALLGDEASTPAFDLASHDVDSKDGVVSGNTIASKAIALAALVKKNNEQRGTALTKFNSAIDFYGASATLANTFKSELDPHVRAATDQTKPEVGLWKSQLDWLHPATYKYLQGDAELQKAEFLAGQAAEDKVRVELVNALKKPLEDAQMQVPGALADDMALGTEAQKSAIATFGIPDSGAASTTGAIGDLSNLEQGGAPAEVKSAASMDLIFAYYAASLIEQSAGDAQKATDLLNMAKEKAQQLQGSNTYVPGLPAEIAPAPLPTAGGTTPTPPAH